MNQEEELDIRVGQDRCLYNYDYTAFCDYCRCITPFLLNKCIICNSTYYKLRWDNRPKDKTLLDYFKNNSQRK